MIFFTAQVDEARSRLDAEAQKREEKIRVIKEMIEAEKQKFVVSINERLEKMIKEVVVTKVQERVKAQVGFGDETHGGFPLTLFQKVAELMQPYQKTLLGNKGRTLRSKTFLSNM